MATLALSWAGAVLDPSTKAAVWQGRRSRLVDRGEGEGSLSVRREFAALRSVYTIDINYFVPRATEPALDPPEAGVPARERGPVLPWLTGATPWPSLDPGRPLGAQMYGESHMVHTVGWPCRAFFCTYRWTNTSEGYLIKSRNGIETGLRRRWGSDRYVIALPIQPLWIGAVTDVMFFGAIAWIPLCGGGLLRRWVRRRRGHCPACAYDLRADFASGCPECGWNRAPRASSPLGPSRPTT